MYCIVGHVEFGTSDGSAMSAFGQRGFPTSRVAKWVAMSRSVGSEWNGWRYTAAIFLLSSCGFSKILRGNISRWLLERVPCGHGKIPRKLISIVRCVSRRHGRSTIGGRHRYFLVITTFKWILCGVPLPQMPEVDEHALPLFPCVFCLLCVLLTAAVS